MKIKDLLDRTKDAAGIESDYALAQVLGINRGRVSAYYSGKEAPNEYACLKISELTAIPLDIVIATVKAESEKDESRREAWENYMKRLGGIAASFVVGIILNVTLIVTPSPAEAGNTSFYNDKSTGIQIMRSYRRVSAFVRNTLKMLLLRVYWPYSPNNGITA